MYLSPAQKCGALPASAGEGSICFFAGKLGSRGVSLVEIGSGVGGDEAPHFCTVKLHQSAADTFVYRRRNIVHITEYVRRTYYRMEYHVFISAPVRRGSFRLVVLQQRLRAWGASPNPAGLCPRPRQGLLVSAFKRRFLAAVRAATSMLPALPCTHLCRCQLFSS